MIGMKQQINNPLTQTTLEDWWDSQLNQANYSNDYCRAKINEWKEGTSLKLTIQSHIQLLKIDEIHNWIR